MTSIRLTEWDCYLLQRAVLLGYHDLLQKPVTDEERSILTKECFRLQKVYKNVHGLCHVINIDKSTQKLLSDCVNKIETLDEQRDWVVGNEYSHHYYEPLLNKLTKPNKHPV